MTQNNPFAKLGALDQQLYQDTAIKPEENQEAKPKESPTEKKEEKLEKTSLLVNQQRNKPAKKQTSKETNQQTSKPVNSQTIKHHLSTKEKKKYGTYLREDSILEIQVHAIQTKRKDHEVLQEIVDFYFENRKK